MAQWFPRVNPIKYISDKIKLQLIKSHVKCDVQMATQEFRLHRTKLIGWYINITNDYTFEVTGFTHCSINAGTGIALTSWKSALAQNRTLVNGLNRADPIVWERHLIQCTYDPDNLLNKNKYKKLSEEECLIMNIN